MHIVTWLQAFRIFLSFLERKTCQLGMSPAADLSNSAWFSTNGLAGGWKAEGSLKS